MERRNKKEVLDITGDYIKIGEKCRNCVYADEPTVSGAKLKCTHVKPTVVLDHKQGWICYCFSEKMLSNNEDEGGGNIDR